MISADWGIGCVGMWTEGEISTPPVCGPRTICGIGLRRACSTVPKTIAQAAAAAMAPTESRRSRRRRTLPAERELSRRPAAESRAATLDSKPGGGVARAK